MSPQELLEALEKLREEASSAADSIKAPHAHSYAWWAGRAWDLQQLIRRAREHLASI